MEIWKNIPGYEGMYQASSMGFIRSIRFNRKKILKGHIHKGYYEVNIYSNKLCKHTVIHRLIAITFLGYNEKPFINHKNGIKTDNRVENLEWCTASENNYHRYRVLGRYEGMRGKTGEKSKLSKIVKQYKEGTLIGTYHGANEASRITGFSQGFISECCRGNKRHSLFEWSY